MGYVVTRVRLPTNTLSAIQPNSIHDWPDKSSVATLRRCAEATGQGGWVLVVERVVVSDGNQRELTGRDLRMLTLFGGRERSLEEVPCSGGCCGVTTRARPGHEFGLLAP
jgi:2,7-dihydroxy-5-methyl-1-naphthoate 7-O-methyltransferase